MTGYCHYRMPRSKDPRVRAAMETVSRNLARVRKSLGMTQEDAARQAGVLLNNLARWERGEQWIDPGNLKLLADVYSRPVDHFYLDEPPWLDKDVPTKPRNP